ncbi:hypothetical protein PENTCL1PPCAC_12053, partial [Pristionchus entomophagus]
THISRFPSFLHDRRFIVHLYNHHLMSFNDMNKFSRRLIEARGKTKMGQCLLRVLMILLNPDVEKKFLTLDDFLPMLYQQEFGDETRKIVYNAEMESKISEAIEEGVSCTRMRWNRRNRGEAPFTLPENPVVAATKTLSNLAIVDETSEVQKEMGELNYGKRKRSDALEDDISEESYRRKYRKLLMMVG